MRVHPVAVDTERLTERFDRGFLVESRLNLELQNGVLSSSVIPVAQPYRKTYPELNYSVHTQARASFLASDNSHALGLVTLSQHWNGYLDIDDLVIAEGVPRKGVGLALIEESKRWATAKGLGGLRAETHGNNVPACALYAKAGFVLGGFDRHLYSQISELRNEVALFCYWHVEHDA